MTDCTGDWDDIWMRPDMRWAYYGTAICLNVPYIVKLCTVICHDILGAFVQVCTNYALSTGPIAVQVPNLMLW
jgi:hypothetical protein